MLGKSVLGAAKEGGGTGQTWKTLLSHQIGAHKVEKASDWLSTEVKRPSDRPKTHATPLLFT